MCGRARYALTPLRSLRTSPCGDHPRIDEGERRLDALEDPHDRGALDRAASAAARGPRRSERKCSISTESGSRHGTSSSRPAGASSGARRARRPARPPPRRARPGTRCGRARARRRRPRRPRCRRAAAAAPWSGSTSRGSIAPRGALEARLERDELAARREVGPRLGERARVERREQREIVRPERPERRPGPAAGAAAPALIDRRAALKLTRSPRRRSRASATRCTTEGGSGAGGRPCRSGRAPRRGKRSDRPARRRGANGFSTKTSARPRGPQRELGVAAAAGSRHHRVHARGQRLVDRAHEPRPRGERARPREAAAVDVRHRDHARPRVLRQRAEELLPPPPAGGGGPRAARTPARRSRRPGAAADSAGRSVELAEDRLALGVARVDRGPVDVDEEVVRRARSLLDRRAHADVLEAGRLGRGAPGGRLSRVPRRSPPGTLRPPSGRYCCTTPSAALRSEALNLACVQRTAPPAAALGSGSSSVRTALP